jgi:hypothetical protein
MMPGPQMPEGVQAGSIETGETRAGCDAGEAHGFACFTILPRGPMARRTLARLSSGGCRAGGRAVPRWFAAHALA